MRVVLENYWIWKNRKRREFLKKKEQGREKNQQEIQVVKVKAIHDKIAESGAWDNKIGMLMEIGLIAILTAFCMICFLTGMDIPVKKMGLSVEIIVLSILFSRRNG